MNSLKRIAMLCMVSVLAPSVHARLSDTAELASVPSQVLEESTPNVVATVIEEEDVANVALDESGWDGVVYTVHPEVASADPEFFGFFGSNPNENAAPERSRRRGSRAGAQASREDGYATHSSGSCAESGMASWYGPGFKGHHTAGNEKFDPTAFTAAHKTLSFGTYVQVTNLRNHRSIKVRINDRGPYVRGRVIDLSAAAAHAIGMGGTTAVHISCV